PEPGQRRRVVRPHRERSGPSRIPAALAVPALRRRGARDHRRSAGPTRRASGGAAAGPRTADLSSGPISECLRSGLDRPRGSVDRRGRRRRRRLCRIPERAGRPPRALHLGRRGLGRPRRAPAGLRPARSPRRLRRGMPNPGDPAMFEARMLYEMARMSVDDGLVMTVHPGIYRSHHGPTLERFGPDTGHDIPVPTSFTAGLQPLLNDFGTAHGFHLVLFTTDETVFSRELAPLAGFYPSVYLGAPWWFLDAPWAIRRF